MKDKYDVIKAFVATYDNEMCKQTLSFYVSPSSEAVIEFFGPRYQMDKMLNMMGFYRCEFSETYHLLDDTDLEYVRDMITHLNSINGFLGDE